MEPADHLSITALAGRYARAVDRRDDAALAALFTPEVVFVLPAELNGTNAPSELAGRDVLVPSVVKSVQHYVVTRHVVEQQILDPVSGDSARGETYCTAHHIFPYDDGHRDKRVAIRYLDTFARTESNWLFSRRELVVDFTETVPVRLPATRDTGV